MANPSYVCPDLRPDGKAPAPSPLTRGKPSSILADQGAGIVGSTRFTPVFVRKYPNMMNSKGFKLLTDGVKVWMKKAQSIVV